MGRRDRQKKRRAVTKTKPQATLPNDHGMSREDAAGKMVDTYQDSINKIRDGRYTAKMAILGGWNDWFNTLTAVCLGLGGALIAVAVVIHFKHQSEEITFWIGTILLLFDGIFVLLMRLRNLEFDSIESQKMGYESEYYFLVAKDRLLDILVGKSFEQKEFEEARDSGLDAVMGELSESYTDKLDYRIDIILTTFLAALGFLLVSAIPRNIHTILPLSIGIMVSAIAFFVYRIWSPKARAAMHERNRWVEKISAEQKKYRPKNEGSDE